MRKKKPANAPSTHSKSDDQTNSNPSSQDEPQKRGKKTPNAIKEEYRKFLGSHREIFDGEKKKFASANLDSLIDLHCLVSKQREGFFDAMKRNAWNELYEELEKDKSPEAESVVTLENIETLYKDYLYHFAFDEDEEKNYNPNLVAKPLRVTADEYQSQKESMGEEQYFASLFLNETPVLFENFCKVFSLKDSVFDLKALQKLYGHFTVDSIGQKTSRFVENIGFDLGHVDMKQTMDIEIPFSNFISESAKIDKNSSRIANNIDLQDWAVVHKELLDKIPNTLQFSSPNDWISILRQDVRGITQPQFNIQLKDSWIGGHQEPMGLKGIYINHGPAANEWFGVQRSDLEKFEELLLEKYQLDIYKSEGLWYGNQHFLRKNGITVVNFVQNKGDLVVVNRGFVYWIKSLGVTVNSGWNLMGNDLNQVSLLLKRYDFNKRNEMENIINVKSYCFDLLLSLVANGNVLEPDRGLEDFHMLMAAVLQFNEEEEKNKNEAVTALKEKLPRKFKPEKNSGILVTECESCGSEILNYFIRIPKAKGRPADILMCFKCFLQNIDQLDSKTAEYFQNYSPEDFQSIVKKTSNALQAKRKKDQSPFGKELREEARNLIRPGCLNNQDRQVLKANNERKSLEKSPELINHDRKHEKTKEKPSEKKSNDTEKNQSKPQVKTHEKSKAQEKSLSKGQEKSFSKGQEKSLPKPVEKSKITKNKKGNDEEEVIMIKPKRTRKEAEPVEEEEEEKVKEPKLKKKVKTTKAQEVNILEPKKSLSNKRKTRNETNKKLEQAMKASKETKKVSKEKKQDRMEIEEELPPRRVTRKIVHPISVIEEEEATFELEPASKSNHREKNAAVAKKDKTKEIEKEKKDTSKEQKPSLEASAENEQAKDSKNSKKTYSQQEQELFIEKIHRKTTKHKPASKSSVGDSEKVINNINNIQNNFSINNNQNFFTIANNGENNKMESEIKNIIINNIPNILPNTMNANNVNKPNNLMNNNGVAPLGLGLTQLARLVQDNTTNQNLNKEVEKKINAVFSEKDVILVKELKDIVIAFDKLPTLSAYQIKRLSEKIEYFLRFPISQLNPNQEFQDLIKVHSLLRTGSVLKSSLNVLLEKTS